MLQEEIINQANTDFLRDRKFIFRLNLVLRTFSEVIFLSLLYNIIPINLTDQKNNLQAMHSTQTQQKKICSALKITDKKKGLVVLFSPDSVHKEESFIYKQAFFSSLAMI